MLNWPLGCRHLRTLLEANLICRYLSLSQCQIQLEVVRLACEGTITSAFAHWSIFLINLMIFSAFGGRKTMRTGEEILWPQYDPKGFSALEVSFIRWATELFGTRICTYFMIRHTDTSSEVELDLDLEDLMLRNQMNQSQSAPNGIRMSPKSACDSELGSHATSITSLRTVHQPLPDQPTNQASVFNSTETDTASGVFQNWSSSVSGPANALDFGAPRGLQTFTDTNALEGFNTSGFQQMFCSNCLMDVAALSCFECSIVCCAHCMSKLHGHRSDHQIQPLTSFDSKVLETTSQVPSRSATTNFDTAVGNKPSIEPFASPSIEPFTGTFFAPFAGRSFEHFTSSSFEPLTGSSFEHLTGSSVEPFAGAPDDTLQPVFTYQETQAKRKARTSEVDVADIVTHPRKRKMTERAAASARK